LKSKEFVGVNTIRIFSWPSTLCKVFSYSNCTFPTSWTGVLGMLYRLYVLMWWKAGWGSTFLAIVTSSIFYNLIAAERSDGSHLFLTTFTVFTRARSPRDLCILAKGISICLSFVHSIIRVAFSDVTAEWRCVQIYICRKFTITIRSLPKAVFGAP
jgi:hypothetical protein